MGKMICLLFAVSPRCPVGFAAADGVHGARRAPRAATGKWDGAERGRGEDKVEGAKKVLQPLYCKRSRNEEAEGVHTEITLFFCLVWNILNFP